MVNTTVMLEQDVAKQTMASDLGVSYVTPLVKQVSDAKIMCLPTRSVRYWMCGDSGVVFISHIMFRFLTWGGKTSNVKRQQTSNKSTMPSKQPPTEIVDKLEMQIPAQIF